MSLFVKDMDNDGDVDIITSDRKPGDTNGVRWLENPGKFQDKEWLNHFIGCTGLEVMFMDIVDLDKDGLEDVVVTEYTNQKIVFFSAIIGLFQMLGPMTGFLIETKLLQYPGGEGGEGGGESMQPLHVVRPRFRFVSLPSVAALVVVLSLQSASLTKRGLSAVVAKKLRGTKA